MSSLVHDAECLTRKISYLDFAVKIKKNLEALKNLTHCVDQTSGYARLFLHTEENIKNSGCRS